ncbi:MAG TPA: hypothetical protein VLV50_00755 [Stellaceae bacterium]|nr:hypothetical protein [Stellaceae bacterium]
MRAWRTDAQRLLGGTLFAALGFCAGPAAAQLGPPVPLVPGAAPATPSAPATTPAVPAAPATPEDIEAQPLAPTDASWAGTLGPNDNALPQTMWRGTERSFVAAALPLVAATESPALQNLTRLVLLSDAAPPAGQDAPDRPSLAALRLDRMLAVGIIAPAREIAERLPADPSSDLMDRDRVELAFAAHDRDGACKTVTDAIARYQNLPWWDRALVACQALAGEGDKAALGLSVLREQKAPADPPFDALIDALAGHARKIEKVGEPTPLRLTLLAAAKQLLPADVLSAAGPAALAAYAAGEKVPALARLPAAERAALLGALAPDALGALYQAIEPKPDEQQAALKDEKPPDARVRAVLYGIARSSAPAATRAAAMTRLFADARKRGAFALAAKLLAPSVGELDPATADGAFAADAARALLIAGETDTAKPWLAKADAPELRFLTWLAGMQGTGQDDSGALFKAAVMSLASRDSGAAAAEADLMVALAAAFGGNLGPLDWAPLLAPPHAAKLPSAALVVDQQQAVAGHRVGETVLSSLLVVTAGDRLSLEPVLLEGAVTALRAVGREPDARALALEAAVDAGI